MSEGIAGGLMQALQPLDARGSTTEIMGRTHVQAARPLLAPYRIAGWHRPRTWHRARIASRCPEAGRLQLGGPVKDCQTLGHRRRSPGAHGGFAKV